MELIILHNNDTHGHLTPIPSPDGQALGGYPRRASFIRQQRAAHPHLLLLDAGDFYQGSKFWHAFKGEPDITLMNMLDYDVAALGNHDFDGGVDLLATRLKQANFPILCANMTMPTDHPLAHSWQPTLIKTIGPIKIGLFSLLVDAMLLYPEDFRHDVQLQPILETAERLTRQLKPQVDLLILLSHLGHLGDVAVAENVAGIDLIIGGHSHTPLEEIHWVKDTPITRSIVGTQYMGQLVVEVEPGQKPVVRDYRLVHLDASFPDDPVIKAELDRWIAQLPPFEVLGQLATPIDTRIDVKYLGESTAGNLYADAALAYFADAADISFVHMGTLRGDRIYGPGDFTNHDLSEYHPFDNMPTLMELTAPQLKLMLETGVSHLPIPSSIFLSQAGLKVWVDSKRPPQLADPDHPRIVAPGQRIIRADYQGRPIDFSDDNRTFKVVMDGYIGRGGAGYFFTQEGRYIHQANLPGSEVVTWYLKHFSPVAPRVEGRIVII